MRDLDDGDSSLTFYTPRMMDSGSLVVMFSVISICFTYTATQKTMYFLNVTSRVIVVFSLYHLAPSSSAPPLSPVSLGQCSRHHRYCEQKAGQDCCQPLTSCSNQSFFIPRSCEYPSYKTRRTDTNGITEPFLQLSTPLF
jgi:hypothetical protein